MSATITTIAGLIENLRQNRMSADELVQWLVRRGPVPSPIHKAELAQLDESLHGKTIDRALHQRLSQKLRELQAAAAGRERPVAPPQPAADKTKVNPASAGYEATAINPRSADAFDLLMSNEPVAEAEAITEITAGRGKEDSTAFTPTVAAPGGPRAGSGPRTGSTTSGAPSASSWERMAAKADGVPEPSVYPGMMLKERFYLEKEVGRGGMGVVYKARDERKVEAQDKNPWVAVKILNDEFRHHPQSLIALQREARKAQQLTHDNILRVYDFDKAGAIVYITMEYAGGGTVKEYIKQGAAKGGWTYAEGRKVIEGMAQGLARAHRDGIVHSDFKPGNVMMGENGVPKVFDLGIARAAKTGEQKEGETTVFDAATLGALTPAYASLEMMRGEDPQIPDDVYALAISSYEVLTGKHPYEKKNAEDALKAGMKPKRIPGLTRKQWQTLEQGLAFERQHRLQTADALIEGMRPRTLKDYALPAAIGVTGVVLVLGGVFGLLLPRLQDARVDEMVRNFAQAEFSDYRAAIEALAAMEPGDQKEVKQRGANTLQDYFFKQASTGWDVKARRYDYASALAVLGEARTLYPDSKNVADNLERVEKEKNDAIVEFEAELEKRVAARSIYENQKDNAVEIMAQVRRMDPRNPLLNNQGLLTQYGNDIRQALAARELELADQRLASALKVYPAQDSLKSLASEVKVLRDSRLAALKKKEQLAAFAKMSPDQVRIELSRLAAAPDFSPDWQAQVDAAIGALAGDATPQTAQLKDSLATAFARQIALDAGEKRYASAQSLAELGLRLLPGAPVLLQEKSKLDLARKVQESEQAALAAAGQIEDLKTKLGNLAKANDIQGAERVFAELKKRLPAGDSFMAGEGPREMGAIYLRQSQRFADQKRFGDAQRMAAAGMKVAPAMGELAEMEKKYGIESRVLALQAGAAKPASADGEQLRAALTALKAGDPKRHDQVMNDLLSTAVSSIQALIPSDRAGAVRGKTEWLKVFPENTRLASLNIPEAVTAAAPDTSNRLPEEARRARGATSPGRECETGFAGFGGSSRASCYDKVGGGEGPRLVVIPGMGGGSAFAMTKYEITVGEFKAFCAATGKCAATGGSDSAPKTGIDFSLAKAYAAWLSQTTGFSYRLPSEAEWLHAAAAAGKGPGADFNCVLMQGDQQIKGGAAIDAKTGKPSGWGLVNVVGNAAEWVVAGGGAAVRGGHFNVPTSRCTVDWRESSSGESNDSIGLRLVREMG